MENYKLPKELSQKIVDGLMEGYKEYIEVRKEKFRTLKVSGAYAWVKGNHIDDKVARACESCGVNSKLAKAGLTWQYLQFQYHDEKILFIIKNARYLDEDQVNKGKDAKGKTRRGTISYMEDLMKVNSNINFKNVQTENPHGSVQLELLEDYLLSEEDNKKIAEIESDFNRFYIVSYNIDENQLISAISLLMPNPKDNKAYFVDDLTKYINSSHTITIDEELRSKLLASAQAESTLDAHDFGIGINTDEDEKKSES